MSSRNDPSRKRKKMVKPNSTITTRQKRLLDEMAESRFASRSEALRTAIEGLHHSLENNGDEPLETLITKVGSIASTLETVSEQIEELPSTILTNSIQQTELQNNGQSIASAASTTDQGNENDEVDDQVYVAVSDLGRAHEQEIADQCGLSRLRVHGSLLRLVEQGMVSTSEVEDGIFYEPAPASAKLPPTQSVTQ